MKRYSACLALLTVLAAGGIFFLARLPQPASVASVPDHKAAGTAVDPTEDTALRPVNVAVKSDETELASKKPRTGQPGADAKTSPAKLTIKVGEPIPELFPHQAEREHLYNLAASRAPGALATIAASLKHTDPSVRHAARQALIQTGDEAAVPHLEDAAKNTTDPDEKRDLLDAAEFLKLPRFMDVLVTHHLPAATANKEKSAGAQ